MEGPKQPEKDLDLKSLEALKTQISVVAIETILLYSCEARTLTASLTKSIDGCYT